MARKANQLTAIVVKKLTAPGTYCDGQGLELQIAQSGAKGWVYRFQLAGKRRQMGLGGFPEIGLAEARERAADARRLVADGIDPIDARNELRAAEKAEIESRKVEEAKKRTFRDCALAYIDDHAAGWKNPKLGKLWKATMETYAFPVFGHLPVGEVDTALVMQVLRPLWLGSDGVEPKLETASRVRMRIENILDWARVQGFREGENPARWKGHLDHLLAERTKIRKVKHHAALPYAEVAAFMADLRGRDALAARALELLILTATRTSEVLNAQWTEIDFEGKVWTIPAERMKMEKEHRIPLSGRAVELLNDLYKNRASEQWVFPGGKIGKPLSNMAVLVLLKRMERADITAHGFRSTFRDWASEQTSYPHEVCEAALAHGIRDRAEAAYRRGDLFEKRRALMNDWAKYCDPKGLAVSPPVDTDG